MIKPIVPHKPKGPQKDASMQKIKKLHPGQFKVFRSKARFRCVVAGRRWGKCLAPNTLIQMADGSLKHVVDCKAGDWIMAFDEDTYLYSAKQIQHLHDNGVKDTLRVKLKNGREIECTPNHPFLVNNEWMEAKDFSPKMLMGVPKSTFFGSERMPDHEVKLLSIWLAEGKGSIISNTSPEILSVIDECLSITGDVRNDSGDRGCDWRISKAESGRSPNGLVKIIRKYGLEGKNSKTKFIPDEIFRLPEDQLALFLNLFVATDGCVTNRSGNTWSLEIGLANKHMVTQLADLLKKFHIHGSIRYKQHKARSSVTGERFESWSFVCSEKHSLISFCENIGAIGKEKQVSDAIKASLSSGGSSNEYLPITYEDAIKHLVYEPQNVSTAHNAAWPTDAPLELRGVLNSWRKQDTSRISRRRFEQLRPYFNGFYDGLVDGDIMWVEVASIEEAGEQQTYDLTVEGNHNFIANGMVNHNTALSLVEIIKAASKPRQDVWYVAPTYRMAKQILWRDLQETIPAEWVKKVNQVDMTILLNNGSLIQCKGADDPAKLKGVKIDFVVLDEFQLMRPETWFEAIRPTLSTTGGRALFIGTPERLNHLYDMFTQGQKQENIVNGTFRSWTFKTSDSPFIPPLEIAMARKELDPKTFQQEYEASFLSLSGQVYYPFNRAVHTGNYEYDPNLPIEVGQDFNVDPMAAAIMQYHPETGEVWIVDEIILANSNTVEACEELDRRYWRRPKRDISVYPDASGGNRQHARGESDLDIFRDAGYKRLLYKAKNPLVSDRINSVNRMLLSADGVVRLRVNKKCKHTIRAFEQVIYKPGTREVDKTDNIEHVLDGVGYYIHYRFPTRRLDYVGVDR